MSEVHLDSPYPQDEGAIWLRGNLHTHTTRSDGADSPQAMIEGFARLGHGFLGLSDHDVLGEVDGLDACGMVLLPGAEITGNVGHVLDVGARELPATSGDNQELISDINRQSGLAVLCHPNWTEDFNHYPYEVMQMLQGYVGIEIFNGVVIDLPGNHLATDKWDRLLAAGRTVWGFANDDAHALRQIGRGWNMVAVRQRTPEAVLAALRGGSFYASSGVEIRTIACRGPVLQVVAPNASRIALFGQYGSRLHLVEGSELTFDASEVAGPYLRVECYGRGGDAAWTQPIRIRNGRFDRFNRRLAELGAMGKAVLHAFRAERPPQMTGSMDDPLWQQAEPFDRFLRIADGESPPVKTEIRCLLAAETLFLAARCQEPMLEEMKLSVQADGQATLWTNDSMEFFLDVEGKGTGCYHLMVSAAGFVYAAPRGLRKGPPPPLVARTGRWQHGPDRGWSAELAVPLEPLQAPVQPQARWGFHACRNRCPQRGTFVWSWVGSSNHNIPQYGSLIL